MASMQQEVLSRQQELKALQLSTEELSGVNEQTSLRADGLASELESYAAAQCW